MSVTFESAVATLKAMFPEWDEETLSALLVSNNYHVEHTIETVLSMGDTGSEENGSGGNSGTIPPSIPARAQSPPVASKPRSNVHSPAPPSSSARYRGTKCELPNDFLRPPSFQNHAIIADEELALMLQNELFQQQARELLGENFMQDIYGQDGRPPANRRATSSRVAPHGTADGQQQQQSTDMGIMKSLNSMGSAAKRNLSSLAASFKSNNKATNSQRNNGAGVSRRGSGTGKKKGSYDDMSDDEGGTEIITFSSNQGGGSRHMLNQDGEAGYGHANTEDEDLDAENPLLQYKSTQNVNIPPAGSSTATRI